MCRKCRPRKETNLYAHVTRTSSPKRGHVESGSKSSDRRICTPVSGTHPSSAAALESHVNSCRLKSDATAASTAYPRKLTSGSQR